MRRLDSFFLFTNVCAFIVFCMGFAATGATQVETFFKSVEHQSLGNAVILKFAGEESVTAGNRKLTLPNTNRLYYGDIVAIGGDFYGIPYAPISDGATFEERMQRFKDAFSELADEQPTYRCDYDFCANKILGIIAGEAAALANQDKSQPVAARGAKISLQLEYFTQNNYLSLAIRNWDHFLPTSIKAYEAGHASAIAQAIYARGLASAEEKNAALEVAYAMNAFTDHFLTDMFSSGHLRVPRRQLYEQCSTASIAGLLANLMHDEDGRVGLVVYNKAGYRWKMLGDGFLYAASSQENARQVAKALEVSAGEVADAFRTGTAISIDNFGIKDLIPQVDEVLLHPDSPEVNSAPLYSLDGQGTVLARTPQNSRCSYNWTGGWGGMSQWLGYRSSGDGSDCKFNPDYLPPL